MCEKVLKLLSPDEEAAAASKRMDSCFLSTDEDAAASKHSRTIRVVRIIWARIPKGLVHEDTYLIQHGEQSANNMFTRLRFDSDAYPNTVYTYVWPTRLKAIKVKALNFLINDFYSFEQAKYWAVSTDQYSTHKLMQKPAWHEACSCALTGAFSCLLVRHLNFFLRESRKAAAWWERCYQTCDNQWWIEVC